MTVVSRIIATLHPMDGVTPVNRTHWVHIPSQYNGTPLPVIFLFHGHSGNGAAFINKMSAYANQGYIIVAPTGVVMGDGNTGWYCDAYEPVYGTPAGSAARERAYIDELLASLASEWQIDLGKLYVAGFSNGSQFARDLYRFRSAQFQGFVFADSGVHTPTMSAPAPSPLRPVMSAHGRQDAAWPWNGNSNPGEQEEPVLTGIAKLREWNNVTATATPAGGQSNPAPGGTNSVKFNYLTQNHLTQNVTGQPFEPVIFVDVRRVTQNAGHRWFSTADGDDFNLSDWAILFWKNQAGLP